VHLHSHRGRVDLFASRQTVSLHAGKALQPRERAESKSIESVQRANVKRGWIKGQSSAPLIKGRKVASADATPERIFRNSSKAASFKKSSPSNGQ